MNNIENKYCSSASAYSGKGASWGIWAPGAYPSIGLSRSLNPWVKKIRFFKEWASLGHPLGLFSGTWANTWAPKIVTRIKKVKYSNNILFSLSLS